MDLFKFLENAREAAYCLLFSMGEHQALTADAPELLHEVLNLLEPEQLQRLAVKAARIHNGAGVIRATEQERLLLKHGEEVKP